MPDVIFKLADEHVDKPKPEQEKILDAEIQRFSKYMEDLQDWRAKGPLLPAEKAIVKTYMIYKLKNGDS